MLRFVTRTISNNVRINVRRPPSFKGYDVGLRQSVVGLSQSTHYDDVARTRHLAILGVVAASAWYVHANPVSCANDEIPTSNGANMHLTRCVLTNHPTRPLRTASLFNIDSNFGWYGLPHGVGVWINRNVVEGAPLIRLQQNKTNAMPHPLKYKPSYVDNGGHLFLCNCFGCCIKSACVCIPL